MVRKLQEQGTVDDRVLAAFARIERHLFLDTALANQAYEDTSLPIGYGQTISKPSVVARMMELLLQAPAIQGQQSAKLFRILEIGTGCGYQAALLSQIATEVYSMERVKALHEKARNYLRPLRFPNVHLILGDGMAGFLKGAPYAAIISAAGGDSLPQSWLDQLAVGGRLVAPVAHAGSQQALRVVDHTPQGLKHSVLETVHFVPLKSGLV
jgi:protein-L-isoaspartate(D-aspartate) O-methyltransferase